MRKKLEINKNTSETDNTVFESKNEKKEYEDLETSEESSFDNVLEEIKENSEKLSDVIDEYLEESGAYGNYEQNLIDLNIPYCKKCKLQFTVDLWGNAQCEKQLIDCPTLKK